MIEFSKAEPSSEVGSTKALVVDFRKLIQLDPDPEKQATLRGLLIEEADKLAKNREQLKKSERSIGKGREQIRRGRERVERRPNEIAPQRDNRDDDRTLELMESVQQLVVNFHTGMLSVYPYVVKLQDRIVGVCATLDEAGRRAEQFAKANPPAVISAVDVAELMSIAGLPIK
jgi:hypothetical protein